MTAGLKYQFSNYAIIVVVLISIAISIFFKWNYHPDQINFMGGDARDYYSSLVSTFITHDLTAQMSEEWYLLKTSSGIVNVHPIGVALLLLPFFLVSLFMARVFGFAVDGYSLPFQVGVALAALFYLTIGLIFLKKLFRVQNISDRISAIIILLIYFGTNLMHYTLSEAGMSHVYSFCLISAFLYFSYLFVAHGAGRDLLISGALMGLILLVRPNNIFIALSVFMWFKSAGECRLFFARLFRNKNFYLALTFCLSIVFLQSIVWYLQSHNFIQNTYKRDGFYWLQPQFFKMLFGFDGGFFIYTPLILLFLFGLLSLYKQNRFSFFATGSLLLLLFYFFSSYWAYTYFDGFGIRVLVDYYPVFAFLGAKLLELVSGKELVFGSLMLMSLFLLIVNLIYTYQANRGILLRAGMNFNKWQYVFLKTSPVYQNVLGGINELKPYAANEPVTVLDSTLAFDQPFNFDKLEYGPSIRFENLGFNSNRIHLKMSCTRKEVYTNSSSDAFICVSVERGPGFKKTLAYVPIKLNETPSKDCCEEKKYEYTANVVGEFSSNDRLTVYIWNPAKQPFYLHGLSVEVKNYNYQLN